MNQINKNTMEILVKKTLDNNLIDGIIVTALEGGSNYWYGLSDFAVTLITDATPDMKGEPLSMRVRPALESGLINIPINDTENPDEVLGYLSAKTLQERTDKLVADGYEYRLDNVITEQYDAEDADVIFQYWVMGEIVFG